MDREQELAHQTVLVDGAKIVAIGPVASTAVAPGVKTIDGKGKWLIPGLIDMHVHFNDERQGLLFVANGVTSVRNMWGFPSTLAWRAKAQANDPNYMGPSIYTAGAIVDGDPPVWPGSHVVTTAAQAEAEVAAQVKDGYDFIKVYNGLPLAAYDALAAAAKQNHIRFAGHLPDAVTIPHAIEAGQTSIEHMTGFLRAAQDATSKGETLKGDDQLREMVAHADPTKLADLAKQLAAAKLANVPTLVVLDRFDHFDHPEALEARPENRFMPPMLTAGWDPKEDFRTKDATPEHWELARKSTAFRKQAVKALADAGAPILAGTDTPNPFVVSGFALHEELAMLVAAGLTRYQALRAATSAAADWIGWADAGRVAVGSRADLVLLAADPLADIAATTKRAGVMLRGSWYTQKELDGKLETLAKSYAAPVDRFAKAPALQVPAGTVELTASYRTSFGTMDVGDERVVVVRAADGGRIIVAQGANENAPLFVTARVELDAKGMMRSYSVDEDGKHTTATLADGKLHIVVDGGATTDTPAPAALLLDANLTATMIPFAARAGAGKTKVAGKTLSGTGQLADVAYTFEKTPDKTQLGFTVDGPFGEAKGSYGVDDKGFPTKIELKTGMGMITVTRH